MWGVFISVGCLKRLCIISCMLECALSTKVFKNSFSWSTGKVCFSKNFGHWLSVDPTLWHRMGRFTFKLLRAERICRMRGSCSVGSIYWGLLHFWIWELLKRFRGRIIRCVRKRHMTNSLRQYAWILGLRSLTISSSSSARLYGFQKNLELLWLLNILRSSPM